MRPDIVVVVAARGEVRLVERAFGLGPSAFAEAVQAPQTTTKWPPDFPENAANSCIASILQQNR